MKGIAMEWMPKDTAPKNGRDFMAWDAKHHCHLFSMHWSKDRFITQNERWSGEFSHWMPLPKPPETK